MAVELTEYDEVALAEAHEARLRIEQNQQYKELTDNAQAILRAVKGWQSVRSEEQWAEITAKAAEDYRTGRFLIEELGARSVLDPKQMAVLSQLRARLAEQHDPNDAAQMMFVDVAILAYYNALRLQRWIGNLSLVIDRELFGQEPLRVLYGDARGETIEDKIKQLGEQLLPLLDRASRIMLRNLKALDELHKRPAPSVSVGQASQVNVAHQQVNSIRSRPRRRGKTQSCRRP